MGLFYSLILEKMDEIYQAKHLARHYYQAPLDE